MFKESSTHENLMRPLTGLRKVKSFQFYASKHFDTSGDKLPLSERKIGIQTVHFYITKQQYNVKL